MKLLLLTLLISFSSGITATADENSQSLSFAPLGNVAFDRQLSITRLSAPTQAGEQAFEQPGPANEWMLTDPPTQTTTGEQLTDGFQFEGGSADRVTCASNWRTKKLTCELVLTPSPKGQFPNLVSLVITEGRDPNLSAATGQFAELFIDLTDPVETVFTTYVYSTSPFLESFKTASQFGSPPEALLSSRNLFQPQFVKEAKRERTSNGLPRIRFALDTTILAKYTPIVSTNIPGNLAPWLGIAFGEISAVQITTYVDAKVEYAVAQNPLDPKEPFPTFPGFIRSVTSQGRSSLFLPAEKSCSDCSKMGTPFRKPSFWRLFYNMMGSGSIIVPCKNELIWAGSRETLEALQGDSFCSQFVAAQLSLRAFHMGENLVSALKSTFGQYGDALLDGEIYRINNEEFLTVNSKLEDLFAIATREARQCGLTTPAALRMADFFRRLIELPPSSRTLVPSTPTAQARKTTIAQKKNLKKALKKRMKARKRAK